jgi:hypothetical protein
MATLAAAVRREQPVQLRAIDVVAHLCAAVQHFAPELLRRRPRDPFADGNREAALRQLPQSARQPAPRQRAQQSLSLAASLFSLRRNAERQLDHTPIERGTRTSRLCAMLMRSVFTSGSFGR